MSDGRNPLPFQQQDDSRNPFQQHDYSSSSVPPLTGHRYPPYTTARPPNIAFRQDTAHARPPDAPLRQTKQPALSGGNHSAPPPYQQNVYYGSYATTGYQSGYYCPPPPPPPPPVHDSHHHQSGYYCPPPPPPPVHDSHHRFDGYPNQNNFNSHETYCIWDGKQYRPAPYRYRPSYPTPSILQHNSLPMSLPMSHLTDSNNKNLPEGTHTDESLRPPHPPSSKEEECVRCCDTKVCSTKEEVDAEIERVYGGHCNNKSLIRRKATGKRQGCMKVFRYNCSVSECPWRAQVRVYGSGGVADRFEVWKKRQDGDHNHAISASSSNRKAQHGLHPLLKQLATKYIDLHKEFTGTTIFQIFPEKLLRHLITTVNRDYPDHSHLLSADNQQFVSIQISNWMNLQKKGLVRDSFGVASLRNNHTRIRALSNWRLVLPNDYVVRHDYRSIKHIMNAMGATYPYQMFIIDLSRGPLYELYKNLCALDKVKFESDMEQSFMAISPYGLFQLMTLAQRKPGTRHLCSDCTHGTTDNLAALLVVLALCYNIKFRKSEITASARPITHASIGGERCHCVNMVYFQLRLLCLELFGIKLDVDWFTSDHAAAFITAGMFFHRHSNLFDVLAGSLFSNNGNSNATTMDLTLPNINKKTIKSFWSGCRCDEEGKATMDLEKIFGMQLTEDSVINYRPVGGSRRLNRRQAAPRSTNAPCVTQDDHTIMSGRSSISGDSAATHADRLLQRIKRAFHEDSTTQQAREDNDMQRSLPQVKKMYSLQCKGHVFDFHRTNAVTICLFHIEQHVAKQNGFVALFSKDSRLRAQKNEVTGDYSTAYEHILLIHNCKTPEQRAMVMFLILCHWIDLGEEKAALHFYREYGRAPHDNWNYSCAGQVGISPHNCTTENVNGSTIKGKLAVVTANASVEQFLIESLPNLLQIDHEKRASPCTITMPDTCSIAMVAVTACMEFGREVRIIGRDDNDVPNAWVCFIRGKIGCKMTENDLHKYNLACDGVDKPFRYKCGKDFPTKLRMAIRMVLNTGAVCVVTRDDDGTIVGDCIKCYKKLGHECPAATLLRDKHGKPSESLASQRKTIRTANDEIKKAGAKNKTGVYEGGYTKPGQKKRSLPKMGNSVVEFYESLSFKELKDVVDYLRLGSTSPNGKTANRQMLLATLKSFYSNPLTYRARQSQSKGIKHAVIDL